MQVGERSYNHEINKLRPAVTEFMIEEHGRGCWLSAHFPVCVEDNVDLSTLATNEDFAKSQREQGTVRGTLVYYYNLKKEEAEGT